MVEGSDSVKGTIRAWSNADSVGRIELATGELVRFGGTGCKFVPAVGLRVEVHGVEPHPLGGHRTRKVTLADEADLDRVLDEQRPLLGTSNTKAALDAFAEHVNALGLLGILLREPLSSRAQMRAWFARAGVAVRFDDPRAPIVCAGETEYRVFLCTADLPDGKGFVSFGPTTPFSIERERELALYSAETGGARVDRSSALAPLVDLVARCSASEIAVTAHQSLNHFVSPPRVWQQSDPLHQWATSVRHQDGQILFSGMRALYLPDLWGSPAIEPCVFDAATALVAMGRRPEVDETLGPCVVVDSGIDWVHVEPA